MKNFKFINQSLWAGSSPNQTGETLKRENRIGVKSWLNRGLMLLITILTLGVGQMWAATSTTLYFCPGLCGKNWTTPWVNVCTKWNSDSDNTWSNMAMSEVTGVTVDGHKVYSVNFTDLYDGARTIEFHASENNWDGKVNPVNASWTNVTVYNNKLCNAAGNGWITYVTDKKAKVSAGAGGTVSPNGNSVNLKAISGTSITATPTNSDTHVFDSWTISGGGITTTSGNNTTNPDVFKATSTGGTIQANFAPRWRIEGQVSGGTWGVLGELEYVSGTTFRKSITLAANTTYEFGVKDRSGDFYKNNSAFVGSNTFTMSTGENNCHIATAEGGTYTFEFNTSTKALTISYPSVTHPTANYVYYDNSGKTWGAVRVHVYSGSTPITSGGWDARPYPATCTIDGNTYYYAAMGGNSSVIFSEEKNSDADQSTATSASLGQYVAYKSSAWAWHSFVFDVTLNRNGGTINAGNVTSYTFGTGAPLPTDVTKPGYSFAGWFDNVGLSGSAITTITTTDNGDKTYWAKWTEVPLSLNTSGNWSTAANWSPACVPTIKHDVTINKPVTIDVANAQAKSVLISQYSGSTGRLTVNAGKALVVATTILKKDSEGETGATEETDIVLESDGPYGTGALVAGSASADTKATVHFYSKAKYDAGRGYINQYFGIPMDSVSKLNYYGSYLRKYDQSNDSWESFSESKLGPWTAYRIMREETSEGTYQIGGKLLLPGTSGTQELILYNNASHTHDNMFANSWTAPIDIRKMVSAFTGAVATIYIFNAGSASDYSETPKQKGASAGNWNSLPAAAVMAVPGDYDLNVIPAQQAFLVQANGSEGTHKLTLDYKTMVYDPLKNGESSIIPTRAPRRAEASDLEIVRMFLAGESGLGDRVLMYVRNDFSADELDNGWEAYKLPGSAFAPQLCAYSGLGEMSISATNVIEGTVLGFYAGTEDSEYTFTFDYEGEQVWYLNDLEAQQSTLIDAETSYDFTAVPGTVAEHRFVISHTPIAHVPTGIDNSVAIEDVKARKQMINGILYIIRGGQIYSTDGQIVK